MVQEKDALRKLYEEKYIDNGKDNGVLVAPQTPGTKILEIFGFTKEGDIYPAFKDASITDIGGGLSSLAFVLEPSAKEIIVVDPSHRYDMQHRIEEEYQRAQRRRESTEAIQEEKQKDLTATLTLEKEVIEGIEKRQKNINNPNPKILINDSLAQHIEGIDPNSQDAIFFNFVLHTLNKDNSQLEKDILAALKNAYRICKPGGKIYGIHDSASKEDEIINALNRTDYKRNAWHKEDNHKYTVFIIEKE